jgi:hypothetical protein
VWHDFYLLGAQRNENGVNLRIRYGLVCTDNMGDSVNCKGSEESKDTALMGGLFV